MNEDWGPGDRRPDNPVNWGPVWPAILKLWAGIILAAAAYWFLNVYMARP